MPRHSSVPLYRSGGYILPRTSTDLLSMPDGTAALPSYTFTSDPNTGLYRSATDTIGLSTAGIAQVTVNADGTLRLLASDRTSTAASGVDWMSVTGTYTQNAASSSFGHAYDFFATLVAQQSLQAFGAGILFRSRPTVKNATGVAANLGPFYSMVAGPTFTADAASISMLFGADVTSLPTFRTSGGGALAVASVLPYHQFWAQGFDIGAGVTVTTRTGFAVAAPTVAGTLTNNYGARIDAQTGGANNYGIAIGTAGTNTLWVAETSNPTTEAGGIVFGSSKDSSISRAAANTLQIRQGGSSDFVNLGGVMFDNFADVSVGGAETDIYSHTTAASTLSANGQKLIASYGGNFVTVGTELTQLKVYFAGTAIWDSTGIAVATGTSSWNVDVKIIRVSSTVVRYNVTLNTTGASGFVYCTVGELTGLTLTNTNIIKLTGVSSGVGSGVGDIIGKMASGRWEPAG